MLASWRSLNGSSSAREKSSQYWREPQNRPDRGGRKGTRVLESHSQLIMGLNDRIFEVLSEIGGEDGDFLCECSNERCVETIQLTLREYAALQEVEERPPLKLAGHPD
jgi:hypothetical protein